VCVSFAAQQYGVVASTAQLRVPTATSERGLNFLQILALLNAVGLCARAVFTGFDELSAIRTPFIAHLTLGHFVVIMKMDGTMFEIFDPSLGERTVHSNWIRKHCLMYMIEILSASPT
jgi:ABC-type bacteriocin/lantibiotic exporter with double-glycine peptidase domain